MFNKKSKPKAKKKPKFNRWTADGLYLCYKGPFSHGTIYSSFKLVLGSMSLPRILAEELNKIKLKLV